VKRQPLKAERILNSPPHTHTHFTDRETEAKREGKRLGELGLGLALSSSTLVCAHFKVHCFLYKEKR
jgi:hypothetical protein